ncbi:MAG: DUF2784 domain-containing protein [Acidimicrobiales bacterium]
MLYRLTADAVVLLHLAYLAFLIGGSLLAWRWPRLVWLHVPSLAWGLVSITVGLECPLTVVENHFRRLAGQQGYTGGFIDHYIEGVVYPERYLPLVRVLIVVAVVAGYVLLFHGVGQRERPAADRVRPPGEGDIPDAGSTEAEPSPEPQPRSAGVTGRGSADA